MTFQALLATLETTTPLHIGTGAGTGAADDLLRCNARGRLLIPGTALAGALRGMATRLAPRLGDSLVCVALTGQDAEQACECRTCQLFGTVNPQRNSGQAAAVLFYDALVCNEQRVSIRDGVGIDRSTGAAARQERSKFDMEVLPAGAQFNLRIEFDPLFVDDAGRVLLATTLAEWQAGRGAIGGRVARGLGAFRLAKLRLITRDLNDRKELLKFLREGPPWKASEVGDQPGVTATRPTDTAWVDRQVQSARTQITARTQPEPVASAWALAEFTLVAEGPFLTHDLVQGGRGGFDHAPLFATYTEGSLPVLPGSSLRGVLRSQAERIARTLATSAAWDAQPRTEPVEYFKQRCPACHPLTGSTTDPVASCNSFIKKLELAERERIERAGADERLCLACRLFGSPWNGSRLRVEDAPLVKGTLQFKLLDFLAIDRFTGGGRDSAKFDALVLWRPQFKVRLFLDAPAAWELGWLALTLRDLHDGLATVGFGRSKGFGRCTITNPVLTVGTLHDTDFPRPKLPTGQQAQQQQIDDAIQQLRAGGQGQSGIYQTLTSTAATQTNWLTLADGWARAFTQMVADHQRHTGQPLENDSYFGVVDNLYQKERL